MHIAQQHKSSKSAKSSKKGRSKTTHYLNSPVDDGASPTASNSRYSIIRSFATAAILIQSMIIYLFIMLNRMRGRQQTWSWSKCTAVHNSMAAYTMSYDLGLYLAGYPMLCFLLCRVTLLFECVLPILIHFIPYDVIKLAILVTLSGMQFGFNVFIRVENFGWSMVCDSVLYPFE